MPVFSIYPYSAGALKMEIFQNTPVIILPRNNTSLRPLAEDSDKLLLNVGNRPIIYHNLKKLADFGYRDILISVEADNEFLRAYLQTVRLPGLKIQICTIEDELEELAILSSLQPAIGDRRFFVLTTDILLTNYLYDFHKNHLQINKRASVGVRQLPFDTRLSDALFTANLVDQKNINPYNYDWHHYACGIFLLEPCIFDDLSSGKFENSIAAFLFAHLQDKKYVHLEHADHLCKEVRNLDDFLHANFDWVRNYYSKNNLDFISARSTNTPFCVGEVYIDPHAEVHPKSILIGPAIIGRGCTIEEEAVIQRSVLRSNVHVQKKAILRDCIVNRDVSISAGSQHVSKLVLEDALNFRLDDFKQVASILKNYPPHMGRKRDNMFPESQKGLNILA
ncbi:MAG: NDP-sugar synthase [Calditrichaeota bacterium]|nr:MAG: NDP-sugar synthase [Calditrichota bacterium]